VRSQPTRLYDPGVFTPVRGRTQPRCRQTGSHLLTGLARRAGSLTHGPLNGRQVTQCTEWCLLLLTGGSANPDLATPKGDGEAIRYPQRVRFCRAGHESHPKPR